jgi:hypothetical protein
MLCLGTRTNDPRHLEALEPADVYEEDKLVFRANCDSTKTEYHDFRGYAGKL